MPPIIDAAEASESVQAPELQEPAASEEAASDFDAQDRDSVAAYMEGLLARSRNWKGGQEPPKPWQPPAREQKPVAPVRQTSVVSQPAPRPASPARRVEEPAKPVVPLEELGPSHRQDKDAVRAHLASMREVANLTARTAIARHTWRKHRSMLAVKFTLATFAFAFAFVLALTGLFGSKSYGVFVWSSIAVGCVMLLELARSVVKIRRAKSRKQMFSQASESEFARRFSGKTGEESGDSEPVRPFDAGGTSTGESEVSSLPQT
jgi:hypothetical protein